MIAVDDAVARVLALVTPVAVETASLASAAGRWTSDAILARRTQPARDLSAMDGWAVRYADLPGPWRIVGESAAGIPFAGALQAGQAVRIFTGAAMAADSDTVVIQEDVEQLDDVLRLVGEGPRRRAEFVRPVGNDFKAGDALISSGERVTPARIALAAMGGFDALPVRRRIKVALVSTGDELVEPGGSIGVDRLPATNAIMLAAMLGDLPVDVTDCGIVADDAEELRRTFAALSHHDLIVSTGGASVGDHDLVRPALAAVGARLDFWRVAMRPGKPLMAGRLGDAVVLGLPGNPVSAFVTAHMFVRPVIMRLSGARDAIPDWFDAELGTSLPAVGRRTDFVRGRWLDGRIVPVRSGDSGALLPLGETDVLVRREADAAAILPGARVKVLRVA